MKKIIISFYIVVLLAGCGNQGSTYDASKVEVYNGYVEKTIQAQTPLTKSNYYDIKLVINKLTDNQYRYDVIVDNPKIAMYNVELLIVVSGINYKSGQYVFPSLGVLEENKYHLVPYQVNQSKGYYKGINLSCIVDKADADIRAYIKFRTEKNSEIIEEFISLSTTQEDELTDKDDDETDEENSEEESSDTDE